MKKLIVLSLFTAIMLLARGFLAAAQTQNPEGAAKPSLFTPGMNE